MFVHKVRPTYGHAGDTFKEQLMVACMVRQSSIHTAFLHSSPIEDINVPCAVAAKPHVAIHYDQSELIGRDVVMNAFIQSLLFT